MATVIDLVKRSELPTPLSQSQFDANYSLIEAAIALKADLNDSRFTDTRVPRAHAHALADIDGLITALAGKASQAALDSVLDTLGNLVDQLAELEPGAQTRSGIGAPSSDYGNDGDFYWDVTEGGRVLYGPKASGAWGAGFPIVSQGDGTIQFMTLAALRAAAEAGTLSALISYRVSGTDQTAITLHDETVPNVVQIASPTQPTTLLIDILDGGQLTIGKTWDFIVQATL